MQLPGTVRQRLIAGMLSISAAAFVGLSGSEGYTDVAVIPVKGDVPTYGFGMTVKSDGTPVRMGDSTTPVKALRRSLEYVQGEEGELRQCVSAPVYQGEWDELVTFGYQYGTRAACASGIVEDTNLGNYFRACHGYLQYRFVGKGADRYDCSTMLSDGTHNKRCWGVWERSLNRYAACMAAQ